MKEIYESFRNLLLLRKLLYLKPYNLIKILIKSLKMVMSYF
jgi:hypothetical protein